MGRRAKRTEPEHEAGELFAERRPRKGTEIVPATPDGMIFEAIKHGITPEGIEKLTRLKLDILDREDRKEAARALARFQRECPPIPKSTVAKIAGRSGHFEYAYADLQQIAETIAPAERDCGLSHSWDTDVVDGGHVKVTCYIRHESGQIASQSSFQCPTSTSAGMSDQQRFASAQMFGRRKSLEQALGLVAVDVPDAVAREADTTPVTPEQAANLAAFVDEVKADRSRFLRFFGVERFEDVPAARLGEAMNMLEQKRKGGAS